MRSIRMSASAVLAALAVVSGTAATAGAAGAATTGTAAAASGAPSARLTGTHSKINVGFSDTFHYSGSHLHSGSVAYLQQFSGKAWHTTANLGAHNPGSFTEKWTSPGAHHLRVVYAYDSRTEAVSGDASVAVLPLWSLSLKAGGVATGQSPRFTYTAANIASGQTVELQQGYGTSSVWKKVATLAPAINAKATGPKLATLGKYPYRLAVYGGGKLLKTSSTYTVDAYANVPLTLMCGGYSCGSGTVQVGSTVFTFTDQFNWTSAYPQYQVDQYFTGKTSCRSLQVRFADDGQNETDYLEFIQSKSNPVYAHAGAGQIGSVTVPLDGGPVDIDGATTIGNTIDLAITGSCYTQSGTP